VGQISQLLAYLSPLSIAAAVLLVFAVIVVIKIGKALVMAGILGALVGGVSIGQGNPPMTAVTHAAIGFAAGALTLFLMKLTRTIALGFLVTAVGVAVLILFGVGR
jgi:hypothetical protein